MYKPSRHLAAHGRQQGEERRPPQPDWLIQHGLNRSNIDAVHTGDCWAAARRGRCRPATREQALDALQRQIPTCTHCRPGTALGILDLDAISVGVILRQSGVMTAALVERMAPEELWTL
ncbi:DUF6233 domain-containing protein, partial [Streptomyces bungoensis]|uniref:DUF6233 domain-containing protein n=1 Tax=Streptomyces bungoensis TaxID=285568 RepID=UPI00341E0553